MSLRLDPADPVDVTPDDRLDEIASIFARGILHWRGGFRQIPPPSRICRNLRQHPLYSPQLVDLMGPLAYGQGKAAMCHAECGPEGERVAAHDRRRADALVPQGVPGSPLRAADPGEIGERWSPPAVNFLSLRE